MKIVILAGGRGTRISEETSNKPKPMVLIDENPIIWHIMNSFAIQGFKEFVIALGYRGDDIKRWLSEINTLRGDIRFNNSTKRLDHLDSTQENDWDIYALETGLNTQTGGRILKCLRKFPGERVLVTYGDGLGNVSVSDLIATHEQAGAVATVTAVRPPARFGELELSGTKVMDFGEKRHSEAGWINGGFFILDPDVVKYFHSEDESFEFNVLPRIVADGQLTAYKHFGFWQPMDTLREKEILSGLSDSETPPWLEFEVSGESE
jgi:glucose-1-phosphate cytidylyltransferase